MLKIYIALIAGFLVFSNAAADTFTHHDNGEVYHGYSDGKAVEGKTLVHTLEKGPVSLNLAQYKVISDSSGRNNHVAIITIPDEISLEIETNAFQLALTEEARKGPLFILIEIDSPGGRVDLAKKMCAAITELANCQVIAFIKGGESGGAYSAAAALSFACDKIYMVKNSVIGAATVITMSRSGKPVDLKTAYGETVGEKSRSAWRNYLASLAQKNGRPGLLAKAMEDKDIEVIEVKDGFQHHFIEPVNRKSYQQVVRTWCSKGTLLTMTAEDAVASGMADKTVSSRDELLVDMRASGAEIIADTRISTAAAEFDKVNKKFEKVLSSLDYRVKQAQLLRTRRKAMGVFRKIIADIKKLIWLKEHYPDVPVEMESLQEELNSVEAIYDSIKTMR